MVRSNRTIANLGTALDSGTSTEFLGLGDSGVLFEPVAYQDITAKPTVLDSASTIALFDSAYVQARQLGGGIDSAGVTGIVDSAYVQARKSGGGLDSAKMTNLIDSAYIAARVTSGLDSSGVTGLVDSSYVTDRFSANSGFDWYLYTATAGQTVFDSIDDNGETLSYSQDGILVFYNGILILKTYDYTATDGTSVTLSTAADSGANVAIVKYGIGSSSSGAGAPATADWAGSRAIFFGGYNASVSSYLGDINYFSISTPGNASDFGDMGTADYGVGAVTGDASTRAVSAGGQTASPSARVNTIEYVTTTTLGNGTDFGDLSATHGLNTGVSSGTRGVFQLGEDNFGADTNKLEYITIATTGNSTDFGDTLAVLSRVGAAGDGTYGLFFGGREGTSPSVYGNNRIQYITIASTGNSTDFGDMTVARSMTTALADTTRAVTAGGFPDSTPYSNVLDYVTIATPGNSTDFGDLTSPASEGGAASDLTYGTFAKGYDGTNLSSEIDYITIQTTGNAADFGDMSVGYRTAGTSGNAS